MVHFHPEPPAQFLRYDAAVAAAWVRLQAEQADPVTVADELLQFGEIGLGFEPREVVTEDPLETIELAGPCGGTAFGGCAETPEMAIADPRSLEPGSECSFRETGAPGCRDRPDVDQHVDPRSPQARDESFRRGLRVADRPQWRPGRGRRGRRGRLLKL